MRAPVHLYDLEGQVVEFHDPIRTKREPRVKATCDRWTTRRVGFSGSFDAGVKNPFKFRTMVKMPSDDLGFYLKDEGCKEPAL
jgi:hypothetical protein